MSDELRKALWEHLDNYIDVDQMRRGGAPVLKCTRFRVAQFFAQLAAGDSIGDLEDELQLDRKLTESLLDAVADLFNKPASPTPPRTP